MNEQRIEAYLTLIERLLTCEGGEEPQILNANLELIDKGLLQTIELVAAKLAEDGNLEAAEFLQELSIQLGGAVEQEASLVSPQEYFNFMGEVLQLVSENPDPQFVYPLLSNNLDKLDTFFAQLLRSWAALALPQAELEESQGIASTIGNFSNLIQQFPMGDKGNNLEIAIVGYEIAASVFSPDVYPEVWAGTQNNLAVAYSERIKGNRLENLARAIACYENALKVYTLDAFPQEWAITQRNLALVQEEKQRYAVAN